MILSRRSVAAASCAAVVVAGACVGAMLDRPPASIAGGDPGDFAFLETQPDSDDPVTYDPCQPIHVVVSARRIVDGGDDLLDEALEQVSAASGLRFVVDGASRSADLAGDSLRAADGSWKPVQVSWSDPAESSGLDGDVIGYAGSTPLDLDGHRWYVTGSVVLDGPQMKRLLKRRDGRAEARATIMHELGHLVGLDHVDEPGQLMQPQGRPLLTTWGEGDLSGLAVLGSGRCRD